MTQTERRPSRIPEFASLKEEAEFWDTHSTTEFEDEWEPVEVDVAHPLQHGLTVSMDRETFFRLVDLAKERGQRPSELVARWIAGGLARTESDRASDARATAD